EHLAPDVQVHTVELDRRRHGRSLDRLGGVARRDPEAELRVGLAGADELMRVGLDSRGDANERPGREAIRVMQGFEPRELVERVDDDRRTCDTGPTQLVRALVVAVDDASVAGGPGRMRDVMLAAVSDVEVHAIVE